MPSHFPHRRIAPRVQRWPGFFAWIGAVVLTLASRSVAAGEPAGVFLWTTGPVEARAEDGTRRSVVRGEPVAVGDTVSTGPNGLAQLRLTDGGILSIRSDTEWRLDAYRYGGPDSTDVRLVIGLVRGGLRSVTGMIGRLSPASYRIVTPTAWIGVRGTDHEPHVIVDGHLQYPPGTYDRVHEGRVVVRSAQAPDTPIELAAGQAAFVGIDAARPVILDAVPAFYLPPPALPAPGNERDDRGFSPRPTPAAGPEIDAEPRRSIAPTTSSVAPAPSHTTAAQSSGSTVDPDRSADPVLRFPDRPDFAAPPRP